MDSHEDNVPVVIIHIYKIICSTYLVHSYMHLPLSGLRVLSVESVFPSILRG
jgi:hypothetical protein